MQFSPHIASQVRRLIDERDDGIAGVATIWRDVGHQARERKLLQPSYESVRRLVRERRRARPFGTGRLRRISTFALELWRRWHRPRTVVVIVVSGDELARLLGDFERRPRDDLSRARTRAAA
jgi:hypothetical protein